MSNTIDELMDRDPLSLSSQDIDTIIAYERKARANFEAGIKPKKDGGDKVSLDISSILSALSPTKIEAPKPKAPRRV